MFNIKNMVHDIKCVPETWIFEHFCKLKEKLTGQDVKIKSLFNPKDKVPSMSIYTKDNGYRFNDFSTGKKGSAVDLIKHLKDLSYYDACQHIVQSYNDYVLKNKDYQISEIKQQGRYKVSSYNFRSWTTQDQYFWTQFNIGSKLLDEYQVKPLSSYTMTKENSEVTITGNYIYGYFKKDGTLYKLYQPKTIDKKFIKVKSYLQGTEQCNVVNRHLLIVSSLKDIMAIRSLKLSNLNIVAADSENTMIDEQTMQEFIETYDTVIIMFDNDTAGIEAMRLYKQKYPMIQVALLDMSKDPADSIKDFGAREVRTRIVPILNKKLQDGKEKEANKNTSTKNQKCRNNDRSCFLEFYS